MKSIDTILKFERNRKKASFCPCGRSNRDGKFAPFLGHVDKGYCHSCGETFFPVNEDKAVRSFFSTKQKEQTNKVSYLPFDIFEKSVLAHENCDLFSFLEKLFRKPLAKQLCENYFIGSNKDGCTTFWQVDVDGNIRQAKVIKYIDGKRSRTVPPYFAGKRILSDDNVFLQQCFFGEFLLNDSNNPVAIVESEKSAVIGSVYHPGFTWIATGGKHGCSLTERSTTKVLKGKTVILFPDTNAYDAWNEKGKLLGAISGCKVAVSDVLERHATDEQKKQGLDIVDFLIKSDSSGLALTDHSYPIIWDHSTKK